MPARSVTVQLQPGVGQAILPDHRAMVPGKQYVIDWDTFEKISNGARQNVIKVVSVQTDATTTEAYVAQTDNGNVNFQDILGMEWSTFADANFQLAGFAAQGSAGTSLVGLMDDKYFVGGAPIGLKALTGPDGARYLLVQATNSIEQGDVCIWVDPTRAEVNSYLNSNDNSHYQIRVDGQGTEYQVPSFRNTSPYGINQYAISRGGFAGVAVRTFNNIGWIQVEGIAPQVKVASSVVAGATLAATPVGTQGEASYQPHTPTVVDGSGVVTGSALANKVFGTALTDAVEVGTTGVYFAQAEIRSQKVKKPYSRFLNKN